MYYRYEEKNAIHVPAPFQRTITPVFMGDDGAIPNCGFSVHVTEWEPGCAVDLHAHASSTEAMYCMAGRGVAEIDGVPHPFVPDSMIVAPPGVSHRITNTGNKTLRVLCVFSPPATEKGLRARALGAVESES